MEKSSHEYVFESKPKQQPSAYSEPSPEQQRVSVGHAIPPQQKSVVGSAHGVTVASSGRASGCRGSLSRVVSKGLALDEMGPHAVDSRSCWGWNLRRRDTGSLPRMASTKAEFTSCAGGQHTVPLAQQALRASCGPRTSLLLHWRLVRPEQQVLPLSHG